MLLCDIFGNIAGNLRTPAKLGLPPVLLEKSGLAQARITEVAGIYRDICKGPRFVVGDDVIEAATDVLMARPRSILDCLSALRVPWQHAWFEWRESARQEARKARGILRTNGEATPKRVGLSVTADPEGRIGNVVVCWAHSDDAIGVEGMPSVCPLMLTFEFDRASREDILIPDAARTNSDIYARWAESPDDVNALDALNRSMRPDFREGARQSLIEIAKIVGGVEEYLEEGRGDLEGEALAFIALMMIMTARGATQEGAEDRGKLNKARTKKGETLLLDHVVVRMRLGAAERRAGQTVGFSLQGDRTGRRAHLVKGHFVNRRGVIFWRRGHSRGLGGPEAVTKTVHVSL